MLLLFALNFAVLGKMGGDDERSGFRRVGVNGFGSVFSEFSAVCFGEMDGLSDED